MVSAGLSKNSSIVDIVGVPMSVLSSELVATGRSGGLSIATADIDHIFPISRYNMRMEVKKANHWTMAHHMRLSTLPARPSASTLLNLLHCNYLDHLRDGRNGKRGAVHVTQQPQHHWTVA